MKHVLLLFAALGAQCLYAQPSVQWMNTAGGFSTADTYHSAADGTGHFYIVGVGLSDFDFGNGITLPYGRVIARYDSSGNISWARSLNTDPNVVLSMNAIAATLDGDLWVGGIFQTDTIALDTFVLVNDPPNSSAFLARIDSNGVVAFATAWSGSGLASDVSINDLWVDDQGDVLATGAVWADSIAIGGISLSDTSGWKQLFVVKLDPSGQALWANMSHSQQDPVMGGPEGRCISSDAAGNTVVAGILSGPLVMDGDTLDADTVSIHAMLITFDPAGALEHMELLPAECFPEDLTVDDAGNTYLCGMYYATAAFDTDTLSSGGWYDGFVVAYAPDGTERWVVGVQGATHNDLCRSISLSGAADTLFVGGTFIGGAWFGDLYVPTDSSFTDGFVMQLDTAGTVGWVKDMTGDRQTYYAEACLDPWDHLYASGLIESQVTYLDHPVENSVGLSGHAFVARFGDLLMAVPSGEPSSDVQLCPNPCNGTFSIALPADASSVVIADAQGRVVQRVKAFASQSATFHLDRSGVYSVTVLTAIGRVVRRVVVD